MEKASSSSAVLCLFFSFLVFSLASFSFCCATNFGIVVSTKGAKMLGCCEVGLLMLFTPLLFVTGIREGLYGEEVSRST